MLDELIQFFSKMKIIGDEEKNNFKSFKEIVIVSMPILSEKLIHENV